MCIGGGENENITSDRGSKMKKEKLRFYIDDKLIDSFDDYNEARQQLEDWTMNEKASDYLNRILYFEDDDVIKYRIIIDITEERPK
jgi:hypothetical protein